MCVQRVQRVMMAMMISLAMMLYLNGSVLFGTIILAFMTGMLLLWAVTDFCPANWMLAKVFPDCDELKNEKVSE